MWICKQDGGVGGFTSYGPCEICGKRRSCFDMAPKPEKKEKLFSKPLKEQRDLLLERNLLLADTLVEIQQIAKKALNG